MLEHLDEFDAVCKDGITYLIRSVRCTAPIMTFSRETRSQTTIKYFIDGVKEVVALSNDDYMIKETGVVLCSLRGAPTTIT
ncbi:hypothetical protein Q6D67_19270 [Haliea sp. E1-2-M8]|uniref:hypothetical protein n=1 Tax=Haliea sp. E1-2-M8 TaxID=3064706 RepID=UPI0027182A7D|nr:hypothetical protein [Haliea sp. E1-2-M8]MDO8863834.1 hypothetical protein [Haliea sp. E1-2-M8]